MKSHSRWCSLNDTPDVRIGFAVVRKVAGVKVETATVWNLQDRFGNDMVVSTGDDVIRSDVLNELELRFFVTSE